MHGFPNSVLLVGVLLIGVAAWGKEFGIVSSIHIIGGVIAVGFFLLLIAIVGLIGAIHHHQVMLFFVSFIFPVGGSLLTWLSLSQSLGFNDSFPDFIGQLDCCGLLNTTLSQRQFTQDWFSCTAPCKARNNCYTCGDMMLQHSTEALKILGGVGLFFSFTEILGVWLAVRYRNQKDPRANPSAFL
ncbi:unnamed protein product [Coregonus sp. 'balchen']|nr:unnamed protein product [Coregonus sp. 'balchen']